VSTYQELKAKAEQLLREAEEVRVREIQGAIDDIRQKMAQFGLTLRDIEPGVSGPRRSSSGKGTKAKAKFRDPAGNTWSGRGKRPKWLTDAIAKGHRIDEFKID
jgi:DNA-binding protein H-NS